MVRLRERENAPRTSRKYPGARDLDPMNLYDRYIQNIDIAPKNTRESKVKTPKKMSRTKEKLRPKTKPSIEEAQEAPRYQSRPKTVRMKKRPISRLEDYDTNKCEKKVTFEPNEIDCFFDALKETVQEVFQERLVEIVNVINANFSQKIEDILKSIQNNNEIFVELFGELNNKIIQYGEDHNQHFRYLCMKLEYDKMLYHQFNNQNHPELRPSQSCYPYPQPGQQQQPSQEQSQQPSCSFHYDYSNDLAAQMGNGNQSCHPAGDTYQENEGVTFPHSGPFHMNASNQNPTEQYATMPVNTPVRTLLNSSKMKHNTKKLNNKILIDKSDNSKDNAVKGSSELGIQDFLDEIKKLQACYDGNTSVINRTPVPKSATIGQNSIHMELEEYEDYEDDERDERDEDDEYDERDERYERDEDDEYDKEDDMSSVQQVINFGGSNNFSCTSETTI